MAIRYRSEAIPSVEEGRCRVKVFYHADDKIAIPWPYACFFPVVLELAIKRAVEEACRKRRRRTWAKGHLEFEGVTERLRKLIISK